jgi:hypothetical protein
MAWTLDNNSRKYVMRPTCVYLDVPWISVSAGGVLMETPAKKSQIKMLVDNGSSCPLATIQRLEF